jgi:hypothetical protein
MTVHCSIHEIQYVYMAISSEAISIKQINSTGPEERLFQGKLMVKNKGHRCLARHHKNEARSAYAHCRKNKRWIPVLFKPTPMTSSFLHLPGVTAGIEKFSG